MKKNVMMRVASIMLVLVLLTSSVISGTFAKYVSTGTANDSARVAKWGVVIEGTGEYFADQYAKDDAIYTGTYSVITSGAAGDALVAPGTTKTGVNTIVITGQPEVASRVEFIGSVTLNNQWFDEADNFYCPIVITIADGDGTVKATIDGATYTSAAEFEAAVETYINNFSKDYDPNYLFTGEADSTLTISWAWPFSTSADNDVRDTYLGDCAAGLKPGKSAGTIEIKVDCTITQID